MKSDRDRIGLPRDDDVQVATHRGCRIEGHIKLDLEVTEVLGYCSAARLKEPRYAKTILGFLRQRHLECYQNENAFPRDRDLAFDGLIHAVIYMLPPTFSQFTQTELALFRDLQQHTVVIPLIAKVGDAIVLILQFFPRPTCIPERS